MEARPDRSGRREWVSTVHWHREPLLPARE